MYWKNMWKNVGEKVPGLDWWSQIPFLQPTQIPSGQKSKRDAKISCDNVHTGLDVDSTVAIFLLSFH